MSKYICHTCRLPIEAKPLLFPELENRAYHPDCFLCQGCGKPIEGEFQFHQDQPYHTACRDLPQELRCSGCGGAIEGSFIQTLGHKWHPEHFVCTNCRAPLSEDHYHQKDGKLYCETCYQSLFFIHCDICCRPLSGRIIRSPWGDQYCSSHSYEFRECSCCRRPVCLAITGGGSTLPDGRTICNLCRKTSVSRLSQAWPAFERVRRHFSQLGLDLSHIPLSLDLADRRKLSSLSSTLHKEASSTSMPRGSLIPVTGRAARDPGEKILVLSGLPWELFSAVCACELGHAWLHLKRDMVLTAEAEGDFCKSMGRRWLQSLGTSSAEVWIKILHESQADQFSLGPRATLYSGERRRSVS
jgi:hypothetical protein